MKIVAPDASDDERRAVNNIMDAGFPADSGIVRPLCHCTLKSSATGLQPQTPGTPVHEEEFLVVLSESGARAETTENYLGMGFTDEADAFGTNAQRVDMFSKLANGLKLLHGQMLLHGDVRA